MTDDFAKEEKEEILPPPHNNNSEVAVETPIITSEYLKANTKIRGWLILFLISLSCGGLISAIAPIATFNLSECGGSIALAMTDVVIGIMMLGMAIYILYSFINRRPDTVFAAKTYIITAFVSNLSEFLIGIIYGSDTLDTKEMAQIFKSLIFSVIWFLYLIYSKHVAEIIPKSYRKKFIGNYILIIALAVIPSTLFAIGIYEITSRQDQVTENINKLSSQLQENERTDGKIIFTIPDIYKCEETETDGFKVYNLETALDLVSITLLSDYDSDDSKKNFIEYWEASKPQDINEYEHEIVTDEVRTINNYKYFYRVTKIVIDETEQYWQYALLFDDKKQKICVISMLDYNTETRFLEFIKGIKFL